MTTLDYAPPMPRRFPMMRWIPFTPLPLLWLASIGLFWEILLPAALAAIVLLAVHKRWRWLLLTLVLSPFSIFFASGIYAYASGTARVRIHGLTRGIVHIDPITRMEDRSSGCIVLGGEWIRDVPHNGALRLMVAIFGPMRGTYTGPFPDKSTAYAALAGATPIDLRDLPLDKVTVGATTCTLAPGVGAKLLEGFREGPATDVSNEDLLRMYGHASAVIYKKSLLILAVPTDTGARPGDPRVLILIDLSRGTPFADYHDQQGWPFTRYVNWR